ncbi:NAD(P)/FAD-dependent oxidoreductase [Sphaerisporangium sp. B11E5]|uniref:flavin-containing monooxygenase n=1 Tax=Sphaerisporangium sp. B11E5 TaxID=3153563 RepID=UPI00325EB656
MTPAAPGITIIGSGFAGLCMAIMLKKAGYHDFVVLEKADDLGGTWRDNTYPGCACDVPSPLYSFSFEPGHRWSRLFAPQAEIWAYLRECARKYDLSPHLRYGTEVLALEYDDASARWRVTTSRGTFTTRAVVSAVGALHVPAEPGIPGRETFAGPSFHSARWDHSVELAGKRVAVIGTGASATQFVPEIAPRVERLYVYQRTPAWIIPRPHLPLPGGVRRSPAALRAAIYWYLEGRAAGFALHPRLTRAFQAVAERHLAAQVPDPALRAKLTPRYTFGCKRFLLSGDYYPALLRDNVELVTDRVTRIGERSIADAAGGEREVDVIVYGTGFKVADAFRAWRVTGRNGLKLQDAWRDGPEAYLGTTVSGFPNLFLLLGPNTGLGHSSLVFMIEAQVRYVMSCLRLLSTAGAAALDVRPEAQRTYNERLHRRLRRRVWSAGGCTSWYLDDDGVNRATWPGFTFEFWARTRRASPRAYELLR